MKVVKGILLPKVSMLLSLRNMGPKIVNYSYREYI